MGVPPDAPSGAGHIAVGDVHSAQKTRMAVDHRDLAVVAVVDFAREARKLHVQEGVHLGAGRAQRGEEGAFDAAAAHVVVEQAHLHAAQGPDDERIAQPAARRVVGDDVVLQVDVVLGPADRLEQRLHLLPPRRVGGDAAAAERYGMQGRAEHGGQRGVCLRDAGGLLAAVFVEMPGHALARAPRDDAALAEVLPEEEVEDHADDRREEQHENPRYRLQRIAVVGHDDQDDADDGQRVDAAEQVCQELCHRSLGCGSSGPAAGREASPGRIRVREMGRRGLRPPDRMPSRLPGRRSCRAACRGRLRARGRCGLRSGASRRAGEGVRRRTSGIRAAQRRVFSAGSACGNSMP